MMPDFHNKRDFIEEIIFESFLVTRTTDKKAIIPYVIHLSPKSHTIFANSCIMDIVWPIPWHKGAVGVKCELTQLFKSISNLSFFSNWIKSLMIFRKMTPAALGCGFIHGGASLAITIYLIDK